MNGTRVSLLLGTSIFFFNLFLPFKHYIICMLDSYRTWTSNPYLDTRLTRDRLKSIFFVINKFVCIWRQRRQLYRTMLKYDTYYVKNIKNLTMTSVLISHYGRDWQGLHSSLSLPLALNLKLLNYTSKDNSANPQRCYHSIGRNKTNK